MRADAAQAVEEMPGSGLDYRPADDFLSFRDVATHIHDVSQGMIGMLLAGDTQFTGPDWREKRKQYVRPLPDGAGPAEIAAALRRTLDEDCDKLARQSPEFLAGTVDKFDGTHPTRMELLLFIREHELTHRAQLFVYLRMNGVIPPTTRRRLAAQKQST